MSRSYRKPYSAWGGGSMHNDKRIYHRRHRAKTREALNAKNYDEIHVPVKNIEVSDVWSMARDGNQCYIEPPKEHDDEWYKKWYKKIKRK